MDATGATGEQMARAIHDLLEEIGGLRTSPRGRGDRRLEELLREAERLDVEMRARPTAQNAAEVELDFARFEDRLQELERRLAAWKRAGG